MLFIDPHKPLPTGELLKAAEQMRSLATDLERLAGGTYPTSADLGDAPILDAYQPNLVLTPVLCGDVTGHPILTGVGRTITTSPLYAVDRVNGWARTQSRLYRLGRPSGAADVRKN